MSIRNILKQGSEDEAWSTIYAKSIDTSQLTITGDTPAIMENLDILGNLNVTGTTNINGNNYSTPDTGQPNYSLHTDGAGATFWAPDDTGSGGITYNGVAPTVAGQLSRFSGVDGLTVDQSAITDNGVDLNLNNQSLTNVTNIEAEQYRIKDDVDNVNRYDIRSSGGELQIYNDTGNVQMRFINNASVIIQNQLFSNGVFTAGTTSNLNGPVIINTGGNSYRMPGNRGTQGLVLKMFNNSGDAAWQESSSYCLSFGGVMNSLPKVAIVNGDPDNMTTNTVDSKTECKIPFSANLRRISYTTETGTGATLQVLKNDVVAYSFNLIAASAVQNVTDTPFFDGQRLSVRLNGGNAGSGTIHLFFS